MFTVHGVPVETAILEAGLQKVELRIRKMGYIQDGTQTPTQERQPPAILTGSPGKKQCGSMRLLSLDNHYTLFYVLSKSSNKLRQFVGNLKFNYYFQFALITQLPQYS